MIPILIMTAANGLGWLVLQLGIAAAVTRMNSHPFTRDNWYYNVRSWETAFYRRWLRIRRWKRLLPDGATWVGGRFRKKTLQRTDSEYLRQFATETRRGEAAHWLMFACMPLFFPWNPPWARIVTVMYAAAANLPCILVQRYNRDAVRRILSFRDSHLPRSDKSALI